MSYGALGDDALTSRVVDAAVRATDHITRLGALTVAILSSGFAIGGFIGILRSGDPPGIQVLASAVLVALLALHIRNCGRRANGARPGGW